MDNESESADLLAAKLASLGFETRTALSGEQAIQVWNDWRPRLIFMDIEMEGISGKEATLQIKKGSSPKRVGNFGSFFQISGSMQVSTLRRRYSSSRRP